MINLAKRNLKIFFREKSAVFFSFLSVLIIIGLYVIFLGNIWTNYLPHGTAGVKTMRDSWIIAGIVSVASVTTAMGAFGRMIEDKVEKISRDFFVSPIRRAQIVGGYILSAFLIGTILSLFTFVLGEAYIAATDGEILGLVPMLKFLGTLILSAFSSSCFVFFIVSFFERNSAFSTASTVIGTLIGFLTGIYLPIGELPASVQWVVKLFPASHATALMRQLMMEKPMEVSFAGAPASLVTKFKENMGIVYNYNGYTAEAWVHVLVLVLTGVVFFLLALWNVMRKSKED